MIENRADLLMRQASMTAHDYLLKAVEDIDAILGAGYAREHPELIGAFMQTAAMDFAATFQADALEKIVEQLEGIPSGLGYISDSNKEVAEALKGIGVHLKYLGTGDAATSMGAIEYLAGHLGEKLGDVAGALQDVARNIDFSELADAIDPVQRSVVVTERNGSRPSDESE